MADRPYHNHSEAELFDDKRYHEKGLREAEREMDRWSHSEEDYRQWHSKRNTIQNALSEIEAEFAIRRTEREERREAQEPRSRSHQDSGLVALVCACQPPRRIRLKERELDGGPVICGVCRQEFRRK